MTSLPPPPENQVLVAALAYAVASVLVRKMSATDTQQSLVTCFLAVMALGAGLLALLAVAGLWTAVIWALAGGAA